MLSNPYDAMKIKKQFYNTLVSMFSYRGLPETLRPEFIEGLFITRGTSNNFATASSISLSATAAEEVGLGTSAGAGNITVNYIVNDDEYPIVSFVIRD